jgi:hypothetical protein
MLRNSNVAERLAASLEGLNSIDLVIWERQINFVIRIYMRIWHKSTLSSLPKDTLLNIYSYVSFY